MVTQAPNIPVRPVLKEYDHIPDADSYRDVKDDLQDEHRERIFARDGNKCQCCSWGGMATDRRSVYNDSQYAKDYTGQRKLHLAHITDASAFVKFRGKQEDIALSYRDDNLITLCEDCHRCSTWWERLKGANNPFATKSAWNERWKVSLERLEELYNGHPEIREFEYIMRKYGTRPMPDYDHRQYQRLLDLSIVREFTHLKTYSKEQMFLAYEMGEQIRGRVDALFAEAIHLRGWKTPGELIAKIEKPFNRIWIESGYVPDAACVYPGAEGQWERYEHEECVWGPIKCSGKVDWCPSCRVTYCQHHGPMHRMEYVKQ